MFAARRTSCLLPRSPSLLRPLSTSSTIRASKYLSVSHPDEPPTGSDIQGKIDHAARYVLNTYARPPVILDHGKGLKVWDTQGRQYLDLTAGIAVNALGHADEGCADVVSDQARLMTHGSNLYHNEWPGKLAELLVESTISSGGMGSTPSTFSPSSSSSSSNNSAALKVFFTNSGTESNEGALKFARKWGKTASPPNSSGKSFKEGRSDIVSFNMAFHGRTFGALSATWQEKYQKPFEPLIPGFKQGVYNDVEKVKDTIDENTCGVIVEPIQGEGGITSATPEFLAALRARCDEVGALLIYDEIQCGLGRSGSLWVHSSLPSSCHPDIVTMAKPLANGVPIGAILVRDLVANVIMVGDHGTTFGGGILATRLGHHVLSRILELQPHVKETSEMLKARLESWTKREEWKDLIGDEIRGKGLILGVPMKKSDLPGRLVKLARERGVLVLSCGRDTIRFVPSLTISKEEVVEACERLEGALEVLAEEVKKEGK